MDLEVQRRVELERLTVDADERFARAGPHLESLGHELVPVAAPAALAERREGDHRGRFCACLRRDGNDAERARVETTPLRDVEGGTQHVGVVRHLDEEGAVDFPDTGLGELQIERRIGATEHLRQQRLGRLLLGLAVAVLLHDRGVDPQRHVVDEESIADRGVVDSPFDRVPERLHAQPWVVAVDSEVEGEVVAGSGRDQHEREVVLDGDRRHQRLGTIAARHAQAVSPPCHCIPGQLLEIEALGEHDDLDAEALGQFYQAELLDLAAARPRVAQQDRVPGRVRGHWPRGVELAEVMNQRGAPEADHGSEQHEHHRQTDKRSVASGGLVHDGNRDQEGTQHDTGDADRPTRGRLGHRPPRTRRHDDEPDHRHDQQHEVRDGEHHDDDREQDGAPE